MAVAVLMSDCTFVVPRTFFALLTVLLLSSLRLSFGGRVVTKSCFAMPCVKMGFCCNGTLCAVYSTATGPDLAL